ncbi:MAG: PilZ domain-containing protein [Myxococcaceae bacterium]|nr:PilZ domain-containing protein [Myxococcaceae bacterium]
MAEFFVRPPSYSYTQARRHPRYPARWHVLVQTQSYRPWDEVANLSEGGLAISTKRPMPTMSLLELLLSVPTEKEPVPVVGRVMWTDAQTMGLRLERSDARLSLAVERLAKDLQRL